MQIFLVGFMGSGKTHWGRIWSAVNPFSFADLDDIIEKEQGTTIKKIFEEKGEEYFRNIETATLRSFTQHPNSIIACGGGTACFNENMHWMNEHGTTVYLKSTPKELAVRLLSEKNHRPVIKDIHDDKLEDFIAKKLSERESFYSQAKIILDTKNITAATFDQIVNFHL
jgi:shikimate kinase